jgi:hypothetical protein
VHAKLEVYPEPVEGPALSLSKGFVTGPQDAGATSANVAGNAPLHFYDDRP